MLGCRCESVDNANAGVGLERGHQVVEHAVRLCDRVIHVHQNRNINRASWQSWIVRLTEDDGHILQSAITHPFAQALQYSGTTSSAMIRPLDPTMGDNRTT